MIDRKWSYGDTLGLQVRVEVTNSTTDPITFDPAKVRLLADREARKPYRADRSGLIPSGVLVSLDTSGGGALWDSTLRLVERMSVPTSSQRGLGTSGFGAAPP